MSYIFKVKIDSSRSEQMLFTCPVDTSIRSINSDVSDAFTYSKKGKSYDQREFSLRMSKKGYSQMADNCMGSLLAPVINLKCSI